MTIAIGILAILLALASALLVISACMLGSMSDGTVQRLEERIVALEKAGEDSSAPLSKSLKTLSDDGECSPASSPNPLTNFTPF